MLTFSIAFVADLYSLARAYLFQRSPLCVQTLFTDSPVCVSSPPAALWSSVASSQLPAKIPMLPLPFPTGEAANDLVYTHTNTHNRHETKNMRGRFFFSAVSTVAVTASVVDLHSAVRKNVRVTT